MKKILKIVIPLMTLVMIGSAYWYYYGRFFQTTDNAYVQTDITHVSSRIDAEVVKIFIHDNQRVKKGDVLALLDDRELIIKKQLAEANLAQSRAEQSNADAAFQMQKSTIEEYQSKVISAKAKYQYSLEQYKRFQALEKQNYISKGERDNSASAYKVDEAAYYEAQASLKTQQDKLSVLKSEIEQANAMVIQAEASLSQAKLELGYTRILAPIDGVISNRNLQVGMMVQQGQSMVSIVSDRIPWVLANFKETQKARMHKGQPVNVTIDAYPGKTFAATIDSLAPATGATFALLPPDNATGNFTKVVQRVPVKIIFDHPVEIDNGLSAVVTVDTR
ncbi:HlyD family secretion protein [Vibrio sp. Of14-4]|uniref:Putative multidrug resistance protein EmrK n=1 Tax=Vibrio aquimaris TaxID=2587862 RepID=A0A5P9CS27_9VIBR|nr:MULTISPECIES: HlyD family secretion protein [Vibrio]MCG7489795.1 HlyD family secretion protein [Vibrio sp. Of14-4]QFT28627.1 putative multidrug resistance protein EmrK [Vibrio aquimaris]